MEEYIFAINGRIDPYWLSRNYVKYFLDKAGGKPVRIKLSSYGGDVGEAVAISNLLAEYGNVTVEFIGFNASAATWLAFGAKKIEIHEDSMWLSHKSSVGVDIYGAMNTDQLAAKIKELQSAQKSADAIDLMIAQKYMDKSGKDLKDLLNLMSESRWMSAKEAKDWGFVDEIIPGINKSAKISNDLILNFEAMGIPVPVIPDDKENLLKTLKNDIVREVKEFFNRGEKTPVVTNTEPVMNKEFVSVNEVLKLEGLPENEGKITFSVDQVKLINEAINAANAAKKTAEDALKVANDSLAAEKTKFTDAVTAIDNLSDDVKSAATVEAKVAVIKNVIEKVPGVKVVSPVNQGKTDFSDVAKDPINNFGDEE